MNTNLWRVVALVPLAILFDFYILSTFLGGFSYNEFETLLACQTKGLVEVCDGECGKNYFVIVLWIIGAYFGPDLMVETLLLVSEYLNRLTTNYAISLPIQTLFAIIYSKKCRMFLFSCFLVAGMFIYGTSLLTVILLAISVNVLRSPPLNSSKYMIAKFRSSPLYDRDHEQVILDAPKFIKYTVEDGKQNSTLFFLSKAIEDLSYSDFFVSRRRELFYFIVLRVLKWNSSYTDHGIALTKFCGRMLGAYAKLGQHFSIRHDLLPVRICKQLESLKESTPPHPWKDSVEIFESRLGKKWRKKLQIAEGCDPAHSASIGQVYFGKYLGEDVVCKVLHKKATSEINADIKAMKVVATAARSIDIHLVNALDVIGEEIKQELDFRTEAANIQLLHYYPYESETPAEHPVIFEAFEDLLILSVVKGESLSKLTNRNDFSQQHRTEVVCRLSSLIAVQILQYGVFHADPHDGNVFYDVKSKILSLIDFGQVQQLSDNTRMDLVKLLCHYQKLFKRHFIEGKAISRQEQKLLVKYLEAVDFPLPKDCNPFKVLHSNLMGDGKYPPGGELPKELVYVFVTFKYLTAIEKSLLRSKLPILTLKSVALVAEAEKLKSVN